MTPENELDLLAKIDLAKLVANGWTFRAYMACRQLIEEIGNHPPLERVEQVLMVYNLNNKEVVKIRECLEALAVASQEPNNKA